MNIVDFNWPAGLSEFITSPNSPLSTSHLRQMSNIDSEAVSTFQIVLYSWNITGLYKPLQWLPQLLHHFNTFPIWILLVFDSVLPHVVLALESRAAEDIFEVWNKNQDWDRKVWLRTMRTCTRGLGFNLNVQLHGYKPVYALRFSDKNQILEGRTQSLPCSIKKTDF